MSFRISDIKRHEEEKRKLIRLYKKLNGVMPIVTVSAVVTDGNRVIVGKRVNEPLKGRYCLVGGALHYAERSEDAAVRKVFEETGLLVRVERLVGVYSLSYTGRIKRHNLDIIFLAKRIGGTLTHDDQHSRFKSIRSVNGVGLPRYVRQAIIDSGALEKGRGRKDVKYRFFLQKT